MRTSRRLIFLFLAIFAATAIGIGVVVWQMTRSFTGSSLRSAAEAAGAMSSLSTSIVWSVVSIVAITLGGLLLFFFLFRRLVGAAHTLIATGIPAKATILSVRDMGVTINNVNAVFEVELEVSLPGRPPYRASAEVMLGRMNWGALQPGMAVAVRVAPDNPTRVAVDLGQSVGMAGGAMPGGIMSGAGPAIAGLGAGMVATPGGTFQLQGIAGAFRGETVRSADEVIEAGERAEATIQAVSHTGATAGQMVPGVPAEKADDPMVFVAMQVQPRGAAAFTAQGIYRVPKHKLGALAIGRRVPVSYLPGEPQSATIVWSRV